MCFMLTVICVSIISSEKNAKRFHVEFIKARNNFHCAWKAIYQDLSIKIKDAKWDILKTTNETYILSFYLTLNREDLLQLRDDFKNFANLIIFSLFNEIRVKLIFERAVTG